MLNKLLPAPAVLHVHPAPAHLDLLPAAAHLDLLPAAAHLKLLLAPAFFQHPAGVVQGLLAAPQRVSGAWGG